MPALCLLPLVENAVLHGLASRPGVGSVRVTGGVSEGDVLELIVDDDGTGSSHRGTQTALADLRERLRLLHGDKACLEAGPRPEGGWRARLRLP